MGGLRGRERRLRACRQQTLRREGLQVYEPLLPTPTREHAPQRHERQDEPREPRVPGDDERHHEQAEPRPQKAGHATFRAAVERPLDFPRAVIHFLDATTPRFAQRAKRSPCSPSTIRTCLLCPAMRTPILARGRGPTARGRCHLSRPRGSRTRSVPGSATHTTPAAPAVNCAQLPDAAGSRRRWSRSARLRLFRSLQPRLAAPAARGASAICEARKRRQAAPPPHQPLRAALIRSRTSGLRKFVYLWSFRPVLSTDSVTMSQCLKEWDTGEVEQRTVPRCPWSRRARGPRRKALAHVLRQRPTPGP